MTFLISIPNGFKANYPVRLHTLLLHITEQYELPLVVENHFSFPKLNRVRLTKRLSISKVSCLIPGLH